MLPLTAVTLLHHPMIVATSRQLVATATLTPDDHLS
jgi:hypothetical protein